MLRREFLAALAAGPRIDYRNYSSCLPDYLRSLATAAYERRRLALAALRTPEEVRARQRWARETFWRLAGGRPQTTPLNARAVGSFERETYRVERVIYESRPGLPVTANLYLPKSGRPPYPGVLFQLGHAVDGKASSLYQYCCQGLVQLGFVVLAFDPMGQGERAYYPAPNGPLTRLLSADDEHTLPGRQMLLTGDTSTRFQVWDAVRSLDYLAAHPLVDAKRLASTGNSGGGTLTMLLAAVDDRLACAAVASGNTENHACANFNPPGSTDDAEQNFIAGAPAGFDRWDTLYPFAPKPLLVLVSAKDSFGTYSPRYLENGREEFGALERAYKTLGKPEQIGWHETPLPHGLAYNMRMEIYGWFGRWLLNDTSPLAEEPPVKAESAETLWCAPGGSVVRGLASTTPRALALSAAQSIATPVRPAALDRLLGVEPRRAARFARLGETRSREVAIESVEVASAGGVYAPAWLFRPIRTPPETRWLVLLPPGGRNAAWNEDSLPQRLAASGVSVCVPELRGVGDVAPEYPRQAARHAADHQSEEAYAWASLMLGKPLAGQRVTDLLAVIEAISAPGKLVVAAAGRMTPVALFAAALEPRIAAVYLSAHLGSYRLLLEEDEFSCPTTNLLFDVLRQTDFPQIAASLAPRPLHLARPLDGKARPLNPEAARKLYPAATITPAAGWDLESLTAAARLGG
jgi:dienelactone hydrolase